MFLLQPLVPNVLTVWGVAGKGDVLVTVFRIELIVPSSGGTKQPA